MAYYCVQGYLYVRWTHLFSTEIFFSWTFWESNRAPQSGTRHNMAVRSMRNVGADLRISACQSKSVIDVNKYICASYCVSDTTLWMYFVVAVESVQVNTFEKMSFFSKISWFFIFAWKNLIWWNFLILSKVLKNCWEVSWASLYVNGSLFSGFCSHCMMAHMKIK